MSNPAKTLKKAVPVIIAVAAIAVTAGALAPVIAGAGGAAAAGGVAAAGGTAATAGVMGGTVASGAAAATGAAASGGLLSGAGGALLAGAGKIGSAVAGASPMVKLGLINSASGFIQGAMTPEPQTAAEERAEMMALQHSQEQGVRNYDVAGGQVGYAAPAQAGTADYQPAAQSRGLIGRYNQDTKQWERG